MTRKATKATSRKSQSAVNRVEGKLRKGERLLEVNRQTGLLFEEFARDVERRFPDKESRQICGGILQGPLFVPAYQPGLAASVRKRVERVLRDLALEVVAIRFMVFDDPPGAATALTRQPPASVDEGDAAREEP